MLNSVILKVQFLTTLIAIKHQPRLTKCLFSSVLLLLLVMPFFCDAQGRRPHISHELKMFSRELADADLSFTLPPGFTEMKPGNNDDVPCDYGIQMPDADFEILFQVRSLKDSKLARRQEKVNNPDSLYIDMGRAQATSFVGDQPYISRNIPPRALQRYNADAGKTFLLNLPDSPTTKHYKYAMLVVLQKNHSGMLLATCFANELGPVFFKNLNMASSCIKFN